MAFMSSDPWPYITQWIQTATGGNVICRKAVLQDRLMFTCAICGQSLTTTTSAVKTDGTVDYEGDIQGVGTYGLQEFVKIHAHKGGHKDATIINTPTGQLKQVVDPNTGEMKLVPIDYELHKGGIPMTADFKKIDLKPEKEQQIKAKIDAYNQMKDKVLEQPVGRKFR
jgi:transcription elongation factor Elf1